MESSKLFIACLSASIIFVPSPPFGISKWVLTVLSAKPLNDPVVPDFIDVTVIGGGSVPGSIQKYPSRSGEWRLFVSCIGDIFSWIVNSSANSDSVSEWFGSIKESWISSLVICSVASGSNSTLASGTALN